jgi:hypothetical protein
VAQSYYASREALGFPMLAAGPRILIAGADARAVPA